MRRRDYAEHMRRQSTPLVIAHRGASGYRPEHTASAYRLALDQGADAVEPDVVPTRDGVLVVRHENNISSTTNVASHDNLLARRTTKTIDGQSETGWFTEDFTWGELSELRAIERLKTLRKSNREYDGNEVLLRLADVLQIVDEHTKNTGITPSVVIEIKHATYFEQLGYNWQNMITRELDIAGWGNRSSQLIIECFELGILETLRPYSIADTHVFLLETHGSPADEVARHRSTGLAANTFAWYRTNEGLETLVGRVDGVSVAKRDLFDGPALNQRVNDLVTRAHQRQLLIYAWTLRPENAFLQPQHVRGVNPAARGHWEREFDAIIRSGVDGIFVDHPDLGVSAVRSTLDAR